MRGLNRSAWSTRRSHRGEWARTRGLGTGGPVHNAIRLNYVSQWFSPEKTVMPELTVEGLCSSGFNVKVLTGIPNFPSGRVFPGYRAWRPMSEDVGTVKVLRAPLFPNHSRSAVLRILNYMSWAVSASVIGYPQLVAADVNVVHASPVTAAIPAFISKFTHGVPYAMIVYDLWPDSVAAAGLIENKSVEQEVVGVLSKLVARLYRAADSILVTSPGQRQTLLDRGVQKSRISLLYNSADETAFRVGIRDGAKREELGISGEEFVICYAGNHGAAQDLDALVQAIGDIPAECRVRLIFVGDGVEKPRLQELAQEVAPGRVMFLDSVEPEELRVLQAGTDINVVSLRSNPLFEITMPSKLQALLASGLPVLGILSGDAAKVIAESGAGITAEPGNVDDIKRAILTAVNTAPLVREAWGAAGASYYSAEMSNDARNDQLSKVVRTVYRERLARSRTRVSTINRRKKAVT